MGGTAPPPFANSWIRPWVESVKSRKLLFLSQKEVAMIQQGSNWWNKTARRR